jgi:hypothetical protein
MQNILAGLELDPMSLAVVEPDRLNALAALQRPREADRGILAAGEQDEG